MFAGLITQLTMISQLFYKSVIIFAIITRVPVREKVPSDGAHGSFRGLSKS